MNFLKNNKVLMIFVAVLLFINAGLLYFYTKKDKGDKRSRSSNWVDPKIRMQNEVGLTQEQMDEYSELRKAHFMSMKPLFNELRTARDSFFTLIYRPGTPDSVISKYSSDIAAKQREVDSRMIKYYWSLKDLCTPEQMPKMDTFLKGFTRGMFGGNRRSSGPGSEKSKK